ncbi:MAG: hypothetical protein R3C59_26400 [Planctomycetaceae bacterium]
MKKYAWMLGPVVLLAAISCWPLIFSAQAAQPTDTAAGQRDELAIGERRMFMRAKLSMVHQIVEGMAAEDFDMVKKGASELVTIAESAAWKSTNDPFYTQYSGNFEHAAKGLIRAAESKSIEKATFAYMHVTMSCTACHQHVRNTTRVAR